LSFGGFPFQRIAWQFRKDLALQAFAVGQQSEAVPRNDGQQKGKKRRGVAPFLFLLGGCPGPASTH